MRITSGAGYSALPLAVRNHLARRAAPTLEKTRLYRYFEDGAAGVMIPHVSTPEKAKSIVDAVKAPRFRWLE